MKAKLLALAAGAAMAVSVSAASTTPANALSISIGIGNGPMCNYFGYRVSGNVARYKARLAGFRFIHGMRFIPRRYGFNNCGLYRSFAYKYGRKFVIVSSARTGTVLRARRIGYGSGPGYGYKVPGYVIVKKAKLKGYHFVHGLKYHNFSKRFTVKGFKFGKKYKLRFSRKGRYLGRTLTF
jgi:hypothetical protein